MELFLLVIVSVISFVLASYILSKDLGNKLYQSFAIFIFNIFLWQTAYLFAFISNFPIFITRLCFFSIAFIPTSFAYFINYFINKKTIFLAEKIYYAISTLIISSLFFSSYGIQTVNIIEGKFNIQLSLFAWIGISLWAMNILYPIFRLMQVSWRSQGKTKELFLFMTAGTIFAFSFLFITGLLFPALHFMNSFKISPYASIILYIPLAYSISKLEFMEGSFVITRTFSYSILSAFSSVAMLLIIYYSPTRIMIYTSASTLAILLVIYSNSVREKIQSYTENKWIKNWYDTYKLMKNIAEQLSPLLDKNEIFITLAKIIKESIQTKSADCFNANYNEKGKFIGFNHLQGLYHLDETNPLVLYIRNNYPEVISLPKNPPALHYSNIHYSIKKALINIVPIDSAFLLLLYSSEKLEGMIILGQKSSENEYDEKDIHFFKTIGHFTKAILDKSLAVNNINMNQIKDFSEENNLLSLLNDLTNKIKIPLKNIQTQINLIEQNPLDKNQTKIITKQLKENIDTTFSILSKFYDFKNDNPSIDVTHFSLDKTINNVITQLEEKFSQKKIDIDVNIHDSLEIDGNKLEIEKAILNTFTNAIEASDVGGQISISIYEDEFINDENQKQTGIVIAIRDTGNGIPEDIKNKIFEPFFTTNRAINNIGLGLSLVKKIMNLHHGKIEISSDPDIGTEVRLYLPKNLQKSLTKI